MRAKKLLALALAGMALTTCLSGCDRTIIEHQFHTDTVTDIVTDTVTDTVMVLPGFYKLHSLFISKGINVNLDCSFESELIGNYGDLKDRLDIMINSPMEEEALKNFYETKGYVAGETNHLLKVIEVTGDYTSALSELAGRVYDELIAYMESSEWSWEKFKEEGNKVEIIVKIYDAYIEDGEDNKKSFFFMALNHVPNE